MTDIPTYHGVGFFGEGLYGGSFDPPSDEELKEMYPEIWKELSGSGENSEP